MIRRWIIEPIHRLWRLRRSQDHYYISPFHRFMLSTSQRSTPTTSQLIERAKHQAIAEKRDPS